MKRKVPVGELLLGMYVTELDRAWVGTPFKYQGFTLKTEEELAVLRAHCAHVFVDPERSERPDAKPAAHGAGPLAGTGKVAHAERVAVEGEIARAGDSYASSSAVLTQAFESLASSKALDGIQLKHAVANMTQSVLRNPDALVLVSAMKERGGYMLDRALKVSVYMILFARFLGMETRDIENAGLAGLLQDVGMLRMPEGLVGRMGALKDEERAQIRTHVGEGTRVLEATPGIPAEVVAIAAMHHERHDGSGYPAGLRGTAISTLGAMAGLLDTYSALTVQRPYADALAPSRALGLIHKRRGDSFHPVMVEEFIRCIGAFPVGSVVELNSGEVGVVIAQNAAKRLQPRVMVVRDAAGNPLRPQKLLDLARSPKASADETYRIARTLEYGQAGVRMNDLFL